MTWGNVPNTSERFTSVDNNLNGALPVKEDYYLHTEERVYSKSEWSPPAPDESQAQYSTFIQSEGFGSALIPEHVLQLPVKNLVAGGPNAKLDLRTGANGSTHLIELSFNDKVYDLDSYGGNRVRQYSFDIPLSELRLTSKVGIKGNGNADLTIVAYSSITYPRKLEADAGQFYFNMKADAFNTYFEIEKFEAAQENFLFDLENHNVFVPQMDGTTAKIRIPQGGQDQAEMLLVSGDEIKSPIEMEKTTFRVFDNLDPEYLILTSRSLNINENGSNAIEDYAAFRESELGGSYKTGIVDVEDLYEQFGYGVEHHSYSVRNFANYIKDKWPSLKMVFIVGKGLSYRHRIKSNTFEELVPTYGLPGSDNLLFAEPGLTYPIAPVGRLAAQSTDDVRNYQRKTMAHAGLRDLENGTIEDRLWIKNIIHLSGGDIGLQGLLFQHLSNMEDTIETNQYAASVKTYRKTSTDPVQSSLSLDIIDNINEGASILTFFGHSSAGTFDFSVEDPNKYENENRNMVILSMGCHSGDIHENVFSLSENMILTEDKGAVAFIASSGNAFPSALASMGYNWYSKLGSEYYGKPLGESVLAVLKDQYSSNNAKLRTLHEQNTLHGDPAITFPSPTGADYVVDFKTINTSDEIGTQDEKIEVTFDIVNLGQGRSGRLNNFIVHEYGSDGKDTMYFESSAPFNRETITLELPNPGAAAIGKNTFNIVLDYDEKITETPDPRAELNNDLKVAYANEGYCFFIFDNSAFPIYPREFAIVNDKEISLMASATNAFADKEYFLFELDTTELFNSPLLEKAEVFSSPGLIKWNPDTEFQDEVVYYWRIIPKEMNNTIWNESSFVYLDNSSTGWNQSHFYQWIKDDYTTFSMDSTSRDFLFSDNLNEVRIRNGVWTPAAVGYPGAIVANEEVNYLPFIGDGEIASGVYLMAFESATGLPYENQNGVNSLYNSILNTPWANNYPAFPYRTNTPEERADAINFIENVTKEGDYIGFYTIQRPTAGYNAAEWASDAATGDDLMTILEKHGAKRVRELADEELPYIYFWRKGRTDFTPFEAIAGSVNSQVEVEVKIIGKWHEGSVQSTVIGPAGQWNKLLWNIDEIDLQQDEYKLDIIGIGTNGVETVLYENVDEFDFDLSGVDSKLYPNLKLNFYSTDPEGRTSAQMEYWRILYEEKPEAVLDTDSQFVFNNDTLRIGEALTLSTVATNITNADMDSLLVHYTIVNSNNEETRITQTLEPLKAMQTIPIEFEYDTGQETGLNQFRVEINPDMAQPEQFDFNNLGIVNFRVEGDNINPLLDLTFDGMHIMDGDIVSSKPEICVILKDESDFLFGDDITKFDLALQKLPDNQSFPVDLNSGEVTFIPGDEENGNVAKLIFSPELESGEYILYVQARDASGNLSGDHQIENRFQVINETSVSNVLNYPNPFSTSTEFIFTLTGQKVPDVFTIQIMTLSGKVVREITKDQLGDLRIGLNRTSYKWDGTDEYGSKLANGVYVYRVFTDYDDEEDQKHFSIDSVDGFFKKGFGKLVILR